MVKATLVDMKHGASSTSVSSNALFSCANCRYRKPNLQKDLHLEYKQAAATIYYLNNTATNRLFGAC